MHLTLFVLWQALAPIVSAENDEVLETLSC